MSNTQAKFKSPKWQIIHQYEPIAEMIIGALEELKSCKPEEENRYLERFAKLAAKINQINQTPRSKK